MLLLFALAFWGDAYFALLGLIELENEVRSQPLHHFKVYERADLA